MSAHVDECLLLSWPAHGTKVLMVKLVSLAQAALWESCLEIGGLNPIQEITAVLDLDRRAVYSTPAPE